MKKLIILIALVSFSITAKCGVRWPFGAATSITGGVNDTLDISSELTRGINYYDIANDTNMVINVTTVADALEIGDLLIIEATEGTASADTLRYGTNITGLYDAIPAGKTKIITFIFNGAVFVKQGVVQID